MTRKKPVTKSISSTYFLPFEARRRLLLIFRREDYNYAWYNRLIKGFNHVFIIYPMSVSWASSADIIFDPLDVGAQIGIMVNKDRRQLLNDGYIVLEVDVCATRTQKLVKPLIQTCTTLVQYLAGISLGTITAQGLYDKLTKSSPVWLRNHGVMEVTQWVDEAEVKTAQAQ